MTKELSGTIAFVTGSGRGLGRVMAAVANAIYNALGKRFYALPMSPPKVLEVLDGGHGASRLCPPYETLLHRNR